MVTNMDEIRIRDSTKRNSLDIAPQALLMAAGVVLSVLLVSIMISQFRAGREMANLAGERILSATENIKQSDILQYDGLMVKGADVINFCKKYLGDYAPGDKAEFTVNINHVQEGSEEVFEYSDSKYLSDIRDSESKHYIKPTGKWKCKVIKNLNGIITAVDFTACK
ncbi:MAG: hypothetical protein MJ131_02665 [Lachnospiraceae bacterium]|nr:hypothetical protein [Lachnospiraceae bacterium]